MAARSEVDKIRGPFVFHACCVYWNRRIIRQALDQKMTTLTFERLLESYAKRSSFRLLGDRYEYRSRRCFYG